MGKAAGVPSKGEGGSGVHHGGVKMSLESVTDTTVGK